MRMRKKRRNVTGLQDEGRNSEGTLSGKKK
jgi:hypothetical protein